MPSLTTETAEKLDGKPIRIGSAEAAPKILTISPYGEITATDPGLGYDQRWRLVPHSEGFLLSSSRDGNVVCHSPKDGGWVHVRSLREELSGDCVWRVGKGGEFYRPEGNGEVYLWLADDTLYATSDGFAAEKWLVGGQQDPRVPEAPPESKSSCPAPVLGADGYPSHETLVWISVALVVTLAVLVYWRRRQK